ncbi:glycine--tRNA ligase [Capnocytophaga sp. oral taxon 863 str. F0517]|uniref:glycine--tRNA ligase n=1 Tax=Capnocytophaga sp. oral taxon 863 TaxID=1227265 RepID=UPI0003964A11|nr:glycine--tRNA ligase [Capnocytophaga sp. oral taxon 863]ERI64892.1 glycine--tRNA ligase [Capnocytophaga sp. oral taxon 863 str. F0517]
MANQEDIFKKVISHAKEYGYIFPSSEIYDGLSAVYDYAQNGVELKKNLREYWWKAMVQLHENIVGIDAAIFMHPTTWKASGHVDAFNDPLIDNKDSKKRYRADTLVEDYVAKIEDKIEKEVSKAQKRFGEAFDKEQFLATNPKVIEYKERAEAILHRLGKSLEREDLADVKALIEELEIVCPISGTKNWTEVKQFNLMFGTKLGATSEGAMDLYLRPETAQGIFVNFSNVQKTGRMKIPFGIAQTGKAFRNEIVARQFIFRMREFEQMEMQFFIKPGTQQEWYEHWKKTRLNWHLSLGLGAENYRFHDHEKLAHYADAACDIEFRFPFGFKELEGIHSRTDFDLGNHEKYSGKKLQYFDPDENRSYVPYVLETSVGLDRLFLAIFSHSLQEETLEGGETRTVLRLPFVLAPTKVAILPLLKKDELPELALQIFNDLKFDFNVAYDEKDAIGRRYRRQDAVGTPFCITVDHQSKEDNTVTLRHRDTMEQQRVPISSLRELILKEVDMNQWLRKLRLENE